MSELREVRVGLDNMDRLANCIVRGGILPEKAVDLKRAVRIDGNVVVEGGVYGDAIDISEGPAEFKNAVFGKREIHVLNTAKETVIFRKAVASVDTVSALVLDGRVIFGADINAPTVRLRNCYVGGSIYADSIELENCVVLGGAFGSNSLSVAHSIVGTFHAPEVSLAEDNYLLFPAAFSVEPARPLPNSKLYSLTLADLASLFRGDAESPESGKIQIDFENDAQHTVLVDDEDSSKVLVNSYSVATRVLASDITSSDRFGNHFLISAGALGTQVLRSYTLSTAEGDASDELTVENIADFFFRILSGTVPVRDLDGTVSLDELKEKFAS